jgi:bifunctional oligoribonuclease and PAP phosphatase NrnA
MRDAAAVDAAADALRSARRVTALCHENPDADTIGAAFAIARVARALGKEAEVVSADGIEPRYAFLGEEDVHLRPQLDPDLAVVCDAASLERVGRILDDEADWFARARLVNIDHHVTNTAFGAVNVVDATAAATCEVVFEVMEALGHAADRGIATALLTGIVRDSQGFADPATSPRTLRIVAALMETGASLADVHRRILGELPFDTLALWGRILATARTSAGGRIVAATLTPDMLAATGTDQPDADGSVEFLARSAGADVVLLLRELAATETRVSVRTTDRVDATRIAAVFGGGGHVRRAGCTVRLPLDAAVQQVVEASTGALE